MDVNTVSTRAVVQSVRTGNDLSAYVFPTSEPQDKQPTSVGCIQWDDQGDAWGFVNGTWQRILPAHVFHAGQDNYPAPAPSAGNKLVLKKVSGFGVTTTTNSGGQTVCNPVITTPSTPGLYLITAMVVWPAVTPVGDLTIEISGDSKTWVTKGRKTSTSYERTLCVNALTTAVSTAFTVAMSPALIDAQTFSTKIRVGAVYLGPVS